MANYTSNKKIADLDIVAIALPDFIIFGDTSDSGKAKAITQANYELWIANSDNFIDALTANSTFITNIGGISGAVDSVTSGDTFLVFSPTIGSVIGTLDVVALANDSTFVTTLAANDEFANALIANETFTTNLAHDENFTTELAGDENFITELTNNSDFQNAVNNFVSGGGGSIGNLAEQFDDFVSVDEVTTGSDDYMISGNFVITTGNAVTTEPEHPGIVTLTDTRALIGFSRNDAALPPGDPVGLLNFEDNFDIRWKARMSVVDTATFNFKATTEYQLISGNVIGLLIDAGVVKYTIGAGAVTTAVTVPALDEWFDVRIRKTGNTAIITLNGQTVYSGAVSLVGSFFTENSIQDFTGSPEFAIDWVRTKYRTLASGGSIIDLTALEDLSAGNTVGFGTNVDGSAIKAVWPVRSTTTPVTVDIEPINAVYSVTRLVDDKYVIIFTGFFDTGSSRFGGMIATLDRDTMTWSFGDPINMYPELAGRSDVVRLGDDKFATAHFTETTDPYTIRVDVFTVSGTTITAGGSTTFDEPSTDNANTVLLTQLDTDRFAMLLSGSQAGSHCDLFEVTVSGTTPTIGTQTVIDSSTTNEVIAIDKIATDKVAFYFQGGVYAASVSGGVWTVGSPVVVQSSNSTVQVGLVSIDTDTFYYVSDGTGVYYCTVSGETITIVASTLFSITSASVITLATDGIDVFLFMQGTTSAATDGFSKLVVNGSSIERRANAPFDMGYDFSTEPVSIQSMMLRGDGYYGALQFVDQSTPSDLLTFNFHIQGMTPYFVGIAQETVSRGDIVSVMISGVDENQSGLAAGGLYRPITGSVEATIDTTEPFLLQGQSGTSIKV